uniref:Elongation factor 1-gamma n=1 Tax=Adelphocoris suturalis TaxID=323751 RepID=A0A2D1QW09_9HEMI|nr:elongation factor 1gamma [Adelphocoris suturalis]
MASGTLYTYPDNFRAYKALIAAQYGGGNVQVAPGFVFGETNKTPEFLKKFPLGKVPAFETKDGQCITESNAIAWYVASNELRGKTDIEKAQVLQWLNYSDTDLLQAVCTWVFPYLGILDYNKQAVNGAKTELTNILTSLNDFLLSRTYLVGEQVTLADIVVTCTLLPAFQTVLDPESRKAFKNVNRWFTTIVNQPKVKNVLGAVKLCEKEPEIPSKADQGGKKDKKKGGDKPQQPKEQKPKEKKVEEVEEMDETELALAAEPKSKDPFDALPKGSWVMDDFKRCYSNEDTDKSIPYFWEHFDKENYSIWLGEYKYNDELKKVFMSCNLITGMFQRLDKMRKHAFASVCLFGKDDDNTISGIWVWRGQGLAFELSPDWQVDYESYSWTKLDANNADHKKMVDDYLAWSGKDKDGRAFNQGKIFK